MDKKNITERLVKTKYLLESMIGIIIIITIISTYVLVRFNQVSNTVLSLSNQLNSLENKFASTTSDLRTNINKNHDALTTAINQEQQNVGNIEQKLGNYSQQVGDVSNTVSTLQKLSKTDPELLIKYSKVFFLNENYAPSRLSEIPEQYKYSNTKILKINSQVLPYLQRMIEDAKNANNLLYVYSAFRSFNEQKSLKGQYSIVYGSGSANSFSADQGYSEHQLGTTIDFITPGLGGNLDGFDTTESYKWLLNNAYRYGYILSYPKNNKFYVFEPWHWRFIGIKLATDLHNQGKSFYDMDQRDIDDYLVSVFD